MGEVCSEWPHCISRKQRAGRKRAAPKGPLPSSANVLKPFTTSGPSREQMSVYEPMGPFHSQRLTYGERVNTAEKLRVIRSSCSSRQRIGQNGPVQMHSS